MKVIVTIKMQPTSGKPRWTKQLIITIPANSSRIATTVELDKIAIQLRHDAVLICDIKYDGGTDRSWWFGGLPSEIPFEKAKLAVTQNRDEYTGNVIIHADKWARVVTLYGEVDFSDNYFELLPGETKVIKWKSDQPFYGHIQVSCWNN